MEIERYVILKDHDSSPARRSMPFAAVPKKRLSEPVATGDFRRPMRRIVEKHLGGDVLHIELANQVSARLPGGPAETRSLVREGRIAVVGAMFEVAIGTVADRIPA